MGLKTSATDALPVRTSEGKRVPPAQENPITMHQLRGLNNHYRSYGGFDGADTLLEAR